MTAKLRLSDIRLRQTRCSSEVTPPDIELTPGDMLCVVGLTGSGKSALARLLAGFGADYEGTGKFEINNGPTAVKTAREIAQLIGYIPTQSQLCFSGIRRTLKGEIELSLELLGEDDLDVYAGRTKTLADQFHLGPLLDRDPFTLSGGECVRAALAVVLAKQPKFLIVDDCLHALDPETRRNISDMLHQLANDKSLSLIELHSKLPPWTKRFNTVLALIDAATISGSPIAVTEKLRAKCTALLGDELQFSHQILEANGLDANPLPCHMLELGEVLREHGINTDPAVNQAPILHHGVTANQLTAKQLAFTHKSSGFTLGPVDLLAESGQAIAVTGPNGAGKTTLLMTLGQLLGCHQGNIRIHYDGVREPAEPIERKKHLWASHVLYAFQDPDNQLYLASIREELSDIQRHIGRPSDPARFERVAHLLGLTPFLDESPLDLPRATRRLVAIGAIFVANPAVMLLDEPTAELDQEQCEHLGQLLVEYVSHGGIALFISHDIEFVAEHATDIWQVENGKLEKRHSLQRGKTVWPLETLPVACMFSKYLTGNTWPYRRNDYMTANRRTTNNV